MRKKDSDNKYSVGTLIVWYTIDLPNPLYGILLEKPVLDEAGDLVAHVGTALGVQKITLENDLLDPVDVIAQP